MFICLTDHATGQPIVLRCDQIIVARKEPQGKINTMITTSIMGPQGLVSFLVAEAVEEVGFRLNRAFKSEVPAADLGFKPGGILS